MAGDFDQRIAAVQQLLALFKWERLTYLAVNGVALVMLLVAGGILIFRNNADGATLTMLFGSSGLITLSIGRLLRMWDQALQLINQAAKSDGA